MFRWWGSLPGGGAHSSSCEVNCSGGGARYSGDGAPVRAVELVASVVVDNESTTIVKLVETLLTLPFPRGPSSRIRGAQNLGLTVL